MSFCLTGKRGIPIGSFFLFVQRGQKFTGRQGDKMDIIVPGNTVLLFCFGGGLLI